MFFHRHTPFILVAGATTGFIEGINATLIAVLGLLLLFTNWRFLKLLQGEKKLKKTDFS